jgi:hypothetical protein
VAQKPMVNRSVGAAGTVSSGGKTASGKAGNKSDSPLA